MKKINFLKSKLNWLRSLSVLFVLLAAGSTQAQTTLAQGDISIVGISANTPKGVAFVTWVTLATDTEIRFTDNGFYSTAASTAPGNSRWQESLIIWKATAQVDPGTVIKIEGETANIGTASVINADGNTSSTALAINNNSADQVFAYQGINMPATATPGYIFNGTFNNTILAGIGYPTASGATGSTGWSIGTPAASGISYLPGDLATVNTMYLNNSATGGQYTGLRTGSITALGYRTQIADISNWTMNTGTSSGVTYVTTSFQLGTPPSITSDPSGSIICAGTSTSFTVAGNDIVSYQWQVNTGSGFVDLSNTGVYSNVTTATMNITGATAAMTTYSYRCVVTGTASPQATSASATLTVNVAPAVTTAIVGPSVCAGGNTSLTGAFSNASTYTWQVNASSGFSTITNNSLYSGQGTTTLSITGATAGMNNYTYRLIASGSCTPVAVSGPVTLTVNSAPSISTNPAPATVCDGSGTFFFVTAGNAVSYQWQVDAGAGAGYVSLSEGGIYSGTTGSVMIMTSTDASMDGYMYRCVVTGNCSPAATSTGGMLTVLENVTYYQDADEDGYGDGSATWISCAGAPGGFVSNFDDCDDTDPTIYPGAVEICYDGIDNNCDGNTDEGCTELTQLAAMYCGTTLEYLNTEYIAADPVADAEQYEFRITNGAYVATATDDLLAGKVRLLQFAGYEYNTTYQVAVRAKVGGVWGIFASECSISTTGAPHSEIDPAQCGTTLPSMSTYIYTSSVNGATQYRFRIINGANVQTIDRSVRNFNMTMLASYDYSTTYTIDAAVEFGGIWSPYSLACDITTPSLATSQLVPTQCGTTLSVASSNINALPIAGATQYRFRIVNGASIQTIEKSTPVFKLTELATYSFTTTYDVDVAIEYNGSWQPYGAVCQVTTPAVPTTQIQASQCGITLPAMATYFYATSVSGATAYRFRITEGANVQVLDNATRAVNITMFPLFKANTTYSVEVAAMVNGTWGSYGSACSLTTPSVPTQVKANQCGTTLSKVDKVIYADAITNATQYRFRVTNGASVQTIDRPAPSFALSQLASYAYGTSYQIDVAVLFGGVWQPYADVCTVTTPVSGSVLTTLVATSCGITVSANTQTLEADKVLSASQYEFLVENTSLGYSQSIVRPNYAFNLSMLTGILPNTAYTVKVRTSVNSVWSAYGSGCTVSTPGSGMRPASSETGIVSASGFDALIFPNPFGSEFGVNVSTSSDELINLSVYDMAGKLMSVHRVSPQELGTLKIGAGYAAGIYQVQVVQGTDVKTLKVVKQ